WRGSLSWHVGLRYRALLDRPHGLAADTIEDVQETLFGHLSERFNFRAVDRHIRKERRRADIPIPNIVMDKLIVPDALAGARVETEHAIGEEIVAQTMAAVVIVRRHLGRNIHIA